MPSIRNYNKNTEATTLVRRHSGIAELVVFEDERLAQHDVHLNVTDLLEALKSSGLLKDYTLPVPSLTKEQQIAKTIWLSDYADEDETEEYIEDALRTPGNSYEARQYLNNAKALIEAGMVVD